MNFDWKSLSLSLIISIIIHGIASFYFLIKSRNELATLMEKIVSEYTTNVSKYLETNKISITIAQGSGFSLEIYILLFVLSFVLITIVSYVLLNYIGKKRKVIK